MKLWFSSKQSEPKQPDLRQRAAEFLARRIPGEIEHRYAPGSIAEVTLTRYAQGEKVDQEFAAMAKKAAIECDAAVRRSQTKKLRDYYRDCEAILREIVETSGAK